MDSSPRSLTSLHEPACPRVLPGEMFKRDRRVGPEPVHRKRRLGRRGLGPVTSCLRVRKSIYVRDCECTCSAAAIAASFSLLLCK